MLLYYITDRSQFSGDEASRRITLLAKIGDAARSGVDFIQLRERDLSTRELLSLAQEAMRGIRQHPASPTRLLVNSRTDVAIAADANGVHLRSSDISPKDVRQIWSHNAGPPSAIPVITVACHTVSDIAVAAKNGADFALFGPVFEKAAPGISGKDFLPTGLSVLREACSQEISIIALGGINLENARSSCDAGAAGVAGIRIFQENQIDQVVRQLRS